ncbi:MAG: hypothetical protein GC159_13005 [Phycisphaera sp.]|nr:hypothetical protein [Phycisphaera sp.]
MDTPVQQDAIPRIIHQVWLATPMPDQVRGWIDGWRAVHGDWEHRLWTDRNMPDLVNRMWFDATPIPAQKADIARYEIVYRYGGLYVDADYECLGRVDGLLAGRDHLLIEGSQPHLVHNGLFAAVSGSPLLRRVVKLIPKRMVTEPGILGQTGPKLFAEAALRVGMTSEPECVLQGVALHHAMGSWLEGGAGR